MQGDFVFKDVYNCVQKRHPWQTDTSVHCDCWWMIMYFGTNQTRKHENVYFMFMFISAWVIFQYHYCLTTWKG